MMHHRVRGAAIAWLLLLFGCDGGGSGTVDLQLEGEDGIREGLSPGAGDETIVDGWTVEFDKFVTVVSDIRLEGGAADAFRANESTAIDLVPLTRRSVARFEAVPAGAWADVFYSTPIATSETARDDSVTQDDLDRMIAEGCTYLLQGRISKSDGERCIRGDDTMCTPVTEIGFDLCVPAATVFGPCESDTGVQGIVVVAGTTSTVGLTIHGDHLVFNGFPTGAEGSVARRAQWLADCDVDADNVVVREDLEMVGASDLGSVFPTDPGDGLPGFTLGGAPRVDGHGIETAWDYLRAQMRTTGHFQGEGECPWDE